MTSSSASRGAMPHQGPPNRQDPLGSRCSPATPCRFQSLRRVIHTGLRQRNRQGVVGGRAGTDGQGQAGGAGGGGGGGRGGRGGQGRRGGAGRDSRAGECPTPRLGL